MSSCCWVYAANMIFTMLVLSQLTTIRLLYCINIHLYQDGSTEKTLKKKTTLTYMRDNSVRHPSENNVTQTTLESKNTFRTKF